MMPAPLGVDQVFTSGRATESRHLPRPGLRSGPAAYLGPWRCQTGMVELGRRVVYLAHLGLGRQGECILQAESDHRLSWNG